MRLGIAIIHVDDLLEVARREFLNWIVGGALWHAQTATDAFYVPWNSTPTVACPPTASFP